jgi:undecaprenyl-diphosphatase
LEIVKVILLGIIQGLTEFLPVSSSGHLVLAAEFLNYHDEGVAFEVFVHLGTLFSVLVVFRKKIINMIIAPYQVWIKQSENPEYREAANWVIYIIVGTIPAALIGLIFKDQIEAIFSSVLLVILMLFVTGTLMISARYIKSMDIKLNINRSFLIGIAQAFAILPGISRSGSTIVTGMFLGVDRSKAAEFSFLLSIPAILGATVIKTKDLIESSITAEEMILLLLGTITAFISGYFAIIWLLDIVKKGKLEWFGFYCYAVVVFTTIWYFLK